MTIVTDRLRLTNSKLKTLRRLCRGVETIIDPQSRAELQFCYRSGYLPLSLVDALEPYLARTDEEAWSIVQEWVVEGPVEPLPDLPERNPELEARVARLRRLAENKDYERMTADVNLTRKRTIIDEETYGHELKKIQRQLYLMANMVFTVLGAFFFGYFATGYAIQDPVTPLRMMTGVTAATVVFFADLYFVVKSVDED